MTATTVTSDAILKQNYSGTRLEYLTYKDRPWWGHLKKRPGFGGRSKPIPVAHSTPRGRSKVYQTSRANRRGAGYGAFLLTRAKDYAHFSIDTEALMASRDDAHAFKSLIVSEANGALTSISESLSRGVFGNTGGSVGRIASGQGTPTIRLQRLTDVVNFQEGDIIVSAPTDGTSGAPSPNTAEILSVNRATGDITATAAFHVDFDDGDYLFHEGDFGASFAGLDAWIPENEPTAGDSFFGVDRSIDPVRYAGNRYVASGVADTDIAGALNNAAAHIMTNGGVTDLIICNPLNLAGLIREATDKTSLDKAIPMRGYGKLPAHLGYSGVNMHVASGMAKVMSDKHCPLGVVYMLQSDTWCFESLGKAPFLFDEDGKKYDREDDEDAITGRFQVFGNLACTAPGRNARVDISAVD